MVCHAYHLATNSQGQGHKFGEKSAFSECGHVAIKLKGMKHTTTMQANILTLHTP